ncbi:hypothetical protein [Carnimonas bestiolae]|uniref:hypothetical protein n=1 Tax=Carnimonas bestiolae TaxID=3402172 RepID=UPI003EDBFD2E
MKLTELKKIVDLVIENKGNRDVVIESLGTSDDITAGINTYDGDFYIHCNEFADESTRDGRIDSMGVNISAAR